MLTDIRVIYLDSNKVVKRGFGTSAPISKISGTTSLLQKVSYMLYTELGTNYISPTKGSKFSSINKLNWAPKNESVIKTAILSSILEIEDRIKKAQTLEPNLTEDETLDKLVVQELYYDQASTSWKIYLLLVTLSNKIITVSL